MKTKSKTIFCDIDGTIFKYRPFEQYTKSDAELLPNVAETFNTWQSEGHHIVLTSARPEYLRDHTIKELKYNNIHWHQLILGIGRGPRYLINDRDTNNIIDRAIGINLKRNQGFNTNTFKEKNLI